MKKSIFFKSYIHKCSIQSGNKFFNFSKIQITHGKTGISFFMMQFYQFLIFQQGNFYSLGSSIYN